MNDTPYHIFLNFVQSDRKLTDHKDQLGRLIAQEQSIQEALQKLSREFDDHQQKIHSLKKSVDELELDLKDFRAQEKNKKHRLEHATSSREYVSLNQELELLEKKYQETDALLLEQWQEYEIAQEKFIPFKRHIDDQKDSYLRQQEVLYAQHRALKDLAEMEERECAKLLEKVPHEWRQQYQVMKEKVKDPMVPVANGVCTGCYMPVPGPDLLALKRHKILHCTECFRLLYIEN